MEETGKECNEAANMNYRNFDTNGAKDVVVLESHPSPLFYFEIHVRWKQDSSERDILPPSHLCPL
jgi:hypothetical protein